MKKVILNVMWIFIGAVLIGLSFAGIVDEFWNGMGSGLLVIGIVRLIRYWRISSNEEYREMLEIEESDERNHFIRGKAWAWAGYLYIIITSISCIIFRIAGQEVLSLVAAYSVGFMVFLYWISYFVLKKKY